MLKRFILIPILAIICLGLYPQRQTIELTFTAVDNTSWVHLDSIKIMNRNQGSDTVLYWPDTVLYINNVGIHEQQFMESAFQVFRNYPNPVADQTTVMLYVPAKGKVSIMITDILGRVIIKTESLLDKGKHAFRFTPGSDNLYFFSATWHGQSSSIKILQAGYHSEGSTTLEYAGSEDCFPSLKSMSDIRDFSFTPGDKLLCIGYADTLQSGIPDSPEESCTYTFQFATNIPCPGMPTVEYEGQAYNTIQIFSQCWLKENLNVGEMIPGTIEQSDNGTIEKYCYNNQPDSCAKYGGLYKWNETMNYNNEEGAQGICPPGWHVPTHEEWQALGGAVDSQYGIGDPEWDDLVFCGYDAGNNLKVQYWSGTDKFGFSGQPGGYRLIEGGFFNCFDSGYWWSSTDRNLSSEWLTLQLYYASPEMLLHICYGMQIGHSVRCLRDY